MHPPRCFIYLRRFFGRGGFPMLIEPSNILPSSLYYPIYETLHCLIRYMRWGEKRKQMWFPIAVTTQLWAAIINRLWSHPTHIPYHVEILNPYQHPCMDTSTSGSTYFPLFWNDHQCPLLHLKPNPHPHPQIGTVSKIFTSPSMIGSGSDSAVESGPEHTSYCRLQLRLEIRDCREREQPECNHH